MKFQGRQQQILTLIPCSSGLPCLNDQAQMSSLQKGEEQSSHHGRFTHCQSQAQCEESYKGQDGENHLSVGLWAR